MNQRKALRQSLLAQSILAALGTVGTAAQAATITVTTNASGTDAADGLCSLAEAIDNANDDTATHADCAPGSGADTVELPPSQTITLQERLPLISSDITLAGNDAIIERDISVDCTETQNSGRFGLLAISSSTVTLQSMTARYGCETYSDANAGLRVSAHAIAADNTTLTLESVRLLENSGYNAQAGGVALRDGTLTVSSSTVSNNQVQSSAATSESGAGIYTRDADLLVQGSVVSGNRIDLSGRDGAGGIFTTGGSIRVVDSEVTGSVASANKDAGAVFLEGTSMTLEDSVLSDNRAGNAGAIYALTSSVTIEGSTLNGNQATGSGGYGMIYTNGVGSYFPLTISRSTVSGNSGGRAAISTYGVGTIDVTDSTFAANFGSYASAFRGSPFTSNVVTFTASGNLFSASSGDLCTLRANTVFVVDNNVATDSTCGAATLTTTTDLALGTLQDNGGPTPTHAINPASSAHDAAGFGCLGESDQRGVARPAGAACDAGAFEYSAQSGSDFVVNEITDDGDGVCNTGFGCTLRDAVLAAESNADVSTVTFDQRVFDEGGTITLTQGSLDLASDTTIVGSEVTITRDSSVTCNLNDSTDAGEFRHLNVSGATVSLSNLTLTNGCADGPDGTGAAARGGSVMVSGGYLTLSGVSMTDNNARRRGGAIGANSGARVSVDGSQFSDNYGRTSGVLYVSNDELTVSNSTFNDNSAFAGGITFMDDGDTVSLSNVTLTGNQAADFGGTLYFYGGDLRINDATFFSNTATQGGSIFAYAFGGGPIPLTITNSVIAGDGGDCNLNGLGTLTDVISTDTNCSGATTATLEAINLGVLADNGGDTPTILPQSGSVLVDASASCTSTDQRGMARPMDADGAAGGDCDIGAVEIINDAPVALGDRYSVSEDTAARTNTDSDGGATATEDDNGVLANDTDAVDDEDGGAISVSALASSPITDTNTSESFIFSSGAEVTLNQDGTFFFDGTGDFEFLAAGETSSQAVDYTTTDGFAEATTALIIDVLGANDNPVAAPLSVTIDEDASGTFGFPVSDADATDTLTVVFDAVDARFTNNNDQTFSFDAAQPEFQSLGEGESAMVTADFTATDAQNASASNTITVNVEGVNDAPTTPGLPALSAAEDTTTSGTFIASDIDDSVLTFRITEQPVSGRVEATPSDVFVFDPQGAFEDLDDGEIRAVSFSYEVEDPGGLTATGAGFIRVDGANDAPFANDDGYTTDQNTALVVDSVSGLLANDTDVDTSDTLTVVAASVLPVSGPGGTLTADSDGSFNYTPPANVSGLDVFTYDITDGTAQATGTVTVRVGLDNQPPVAVDDDYTSDENGALSVSAPGVLDNDTDPESNPLSVNSSGTFVAQGIGGMMTLNADGSFDYTPPANTSGVASVLYTVTDGFGNTDAATITITVSNIDDAPTASDDLLTPVLEGADTQAIPASSLLANDSAGAGDSTDSIRITQVSAIAGVLATVDDGGTSNPADDTVRVTPLDDFFGEASLSYSIEDDAGTPAMATARLAVTPVNDPPEFSLLGDQSFSAGTAGVQVVDGFVNVTTLGPNEIDQLVQRIDVATVSDPDGVVDLITVDDNGRLSLVLSGSNGSATFAVTVTDNGGTANGGVDTAASQTFRVNVGQDPDVLFVDGFETPVINGSFKSRSIVLSKASLEERALERAAPTLVMRAKHPTTPAYVETYGRITAMGLQIQLVRFEDGAITKGEWQSLHGDNVTIRW
ncbi:MAG: Ig-like domain-containing protein [Pseudomonadota bacterium]